MGSFVGSAVGSVEGSMDEEVVGFSEGDNDGVRVGPVCLGFVIYSAKDKRMDHINWVLAGSYPHTCDNIC